MNCKKDNGYAYASRIHAALRHAGASVCADKKTAAALNIPVELDYAGIDALFILGGDGTILRAAVGCARHNVKIMGVNLGRMGFLTEADIPDIEDVVRRFMRGDYHTEKRMMLKAEVFSSGGDALLEAHALNDAVITKQNLSRLIDIELFVNSQLADAFNGDGIILSTPTGSTAYSLSAGGPIVCPALECMVATPVCAHTLHSRSIVLKSTDIIEIKQCARIEGAILSLDGRETSELAKGDIVRVTRSPYAAEFIRMKERRFYSLVRSKLSMRNDSGDGGRVE